MPSEQQLQHIACIGAGYVGAITSAVIALKNPGLLITVVDANERRIKGWNQPNRMPISEPGLSEMIDSTRTVRSGRQSNLVFSTDVGKVVQDARLIFIAVDTPLATVNTNNKVDLDITNVDNAIRAIGKFSYSSKIIVLKSTVPVGTCCKIQKLLDTWRRPNITFDILSNPEFLSQGTAVQDLLQPDRVIIGSESHERGKNAAGVLSKIYESWVPKNRIFHMLSQSAELSKLAANALLAQRISSINALSILCDATGGDVEEVSQAVGLDHRIGPYMLKASLGFGGSCLEKDVLALATVSDLSRDPVMGSYWRSIVQVNEYQKLGFANMVIFALAGYTIGSILSGLKVAVFGIAYKKGTDDTRGSPAIDLIARLLNAGAQVEVWDPTNTSPALDGIFDARGAGDHAVKDSLNVARSPIDACRYANAVVIATDRDEFKNHTGHDMAADEVAAGPTARSIDSSSELANSTKARTGEPSGVAGKASSYTIDIGSEVVDWSSLAQAMRAPKFVFDGHNILDRGKLTALGFSVYGIGKGWSYSD